MKKILLDVDDVLSGDFTEKWVGIYNEVWGDNLDYKIITEWDITKFVKPECGYGIFELLKTPGLFSEMVTPPPYSVQVTKELSKYYHLFIVTHSIHPQTIAEKHIYLKRHFPHISEDNFIFCKKKFMVKGDYLIDDYHENLRTFGGKKILYNTPHAVVLDDFHVVNGWKDIATYFTKEINRDLANQYLYGHGDGLIEKIFNEG